MELKHILRCPKCHSFLDYEESMCNICGARFSIIDGIYDFIDVSQVESQQEKEIHLHKQLVENYTQKSSFHFSRVYSDYWNDQFLSHLPKSPELVLDCGCGTGELTRALIRESAMTIGMDISLEMLLQAQKWIGKRSNAFWVRNPGESLPFTSNAFDAVCFRGSLHHMSHEQMALKEAYRILKPGGKLLLSEPNDDSLLLRLPREISNRMLERFGNDHKAFRSKLWLCQIEAIGFDILFTKYFSFLSQPLCGMSELLPIMKVLPNAHKAAQFLVDLDEFCSRLPLIQQQSFDFFVAARK